jgi:hypothetical protein
MNFWEEEARISLSCTICCGDLWQVDMVVPFFSFSQMKYFYSWLNYDDTY